MDASKYRPGYFPPPGKYDQWTSRSHIDHPPAWCSVDLRDGNQSLVIPMTPEEKLSWFHTLVKMGFREIEVGFPASNEQEFAFVRRLIEEELIPEGVTIQVLTQCREHIIRRTFEALRGAPSAIVHFYTSTSVAQREQVFRMSKEALLQMTVDGARLIRQCAEETEGSFRFEYSPESFTGTEPEYALEVCNAVLEVLEPSETNNVIINLPVTVETSLPHVYASQVEYIHQNLRYRDHVTLSIHPHNDRGTGVADAELGMLAGAQRVEGTLFGNGERTGNVDLVTLAMNLYSHGVDPGLDFSDLPELVERFESCTRMRVHERSPYAGDLVFVAFSGSHQDAIAKSLHHRTEHGEHQWNIPYLPIDPRDIGRGYDSDVIRVNSQSGKGGIGYLLEHAHGYVLPKPMREHFSALCKGISIRAHKELRSPEIFEIFKATYFCHQAPLAVEHMNLSRRDRAVHAELVFSRKGELTTLISEGNGSLDAISNALKAFTGVSYTLQVYTEHSMQEQGSGSVAAAYIGIRSESGEMYWGVGTDTDIIHAGAHALLSAFNNMVKKEDLLC